MNHLFLYNIIVRHNLMIRRIPEVVIEDGVERIPPHAGHWMCQPSPDSMIATVTWSTSLNHPAPTLEGSVNLYLESLESNG